MNTTTRFRRATLADLPALLSLARRYYSEEGYRFAPRTIRAALAGLLSEPSRGFAWIAESDHAAVAYLILTFGWSVEHGGRDAFLDELYVAPKFRGRGLASAALELAERAAARAGVRSLHLEVESQNPRAAAIYSRRGFEDRSRRLLTKLLDPAAASAATPRVRGRRKHPSTRRGRASSRS